MQSETVFGQAGHWSDPMLTPLDIQRSGNVGIGLPGGTTPLRPLHLNGFFLFDSPTNFAIETGFGNLFMHNGGIEENTFLGFRSGINNTSGMNNTFIGHRSGFLNDDGSNNTFLGTLAAFNNDADDNISIGYRSMYSSMLNSENTVVGNNALENYTFGDRNSVLGKFAGESMDESYDMVTLGYGALRYTALGQRSIVAGYEAGGMANSVNYSVLVGAQAGNTAANLEWCTYLGAGVASNSATFGWGNTLIGAESGQDLTNSEGNTFVGLNSGVNFIDGNYTVAIGAGTGVSGSSHAGDYNTLLGTGAQVNTSSGTAVTSSSAIGYNSEVCDDYTMVLGNHSGPNPTTVVIGDCQASSAGPGELEVAGDIWAWSGGWNTSDQRLKSNIEPLENSLDKINALNSYTYTYKRNDKFKLPLGEQVGLLAQELLEVYPYAVKEGKSGYYGVDYSKVVPLLLQGIKEQQDSIVVLRTELDELKQEVEEIKDELGISKPNVPGTNPGKNELKGSLKQNAPNPFNEETVISYTIDGDFNQGVISILDFNGQQIRELRINETTGEVRFNGSGYPSGIYFYGLFVDGELLDIKKMIIAK